MKSNRLWKRMIAFGLCLAMLSGDVTTLAAEMTDGSVESMESTESAENTADSVENVVTENTESVENTEIVENVDATESIDTTEAIENLDVTAEEKVRFDYKSDLVNVVVTLNDEKDLPENAELVVSPVEVTKEMQNTINEAAIEAKTAVNSISAFDISFMVDGVEVEPGSTVKVQITLPEVIAGDTASVYHYDEAADAAEDMQAEVAADGTVEFDTTHFSTYIIVNEGNATVTVTIQHINSTTGAKIYADDVRQLTVGARINDYKKANNWTVQKVTSVEESGENVLENTDQIEVVSDMTIKVYYEAAISTIDGETTFFDYLVKPVQSGFFDAYGNYSSEWKWGYDYKTVERPDLSINTASNYADSNSADNKERLIAGCKNQNYSENQYDACILVNGTEKNANNYVGGTAGLVTGLVLGLSEDCSDVTFSMDEPGFFSLDEKTGKTILDGYTLQFERTGDTYELATVKDADQNVVANAGDGFFPLDSAASNVIDNGYGNSHNYYFGMRYDIRFTLGDYVGPLNYSFTGDDDLWVILDGKQVVIDLGGIHDALSAEVNLWDALGLKEGVGATTEEEKNEEHCLTILYMERGGHASNCQMKFTIPSAEIVSVTSSTASVTLNKVNASDEPLAGANFKLVNDATGNTVSATSQKDGKVTFRNLKVGAYTLSETVAPDGYTATEETWNVVVTEETEGNIVAKVYNANGTELEGNKIVNLKTEDVLESDKTATLVDWDDRTYDITLSASSTAEHTTGGSTIVTETKAVVDVVLVLDVSNSMKGSKLSDLKTAATEFVSNLFTNADENSTIAVVTFNSKVSTPVSQVTLGNTTADSINTTINKMSTSAGTNHAIGLEAAKNILAQSSLDEGRSKYVILFTDGEPTNVNAISKDYDTVSEVMTAATKFASTIKAMENSYIYTIQLGSLNSKYESWFKDLSSGAGYSYDTTASIDLSSIFESIRKEITTPTVTESIALTDAIVVDTIDARFELTDGEKERLEADGAIVTVNADGTTTITWTGQTINAAKEADGAMTPGWSKVIHVKAKDDYIGGNAVATNVNPGSHIEVNGAQVEFEQPKVNVKIVNELKDASDTIFLGETLEKYFTSAKEQEMLGKIAEMNTYNDSEVSISWKDADGITVAAGDIRNAAPEKHTEYTLTVEITPNTASDSEAAMAAAESMKNADGKLYAAGVDQDTATYTVEIVTGTITITKKINQDSYDANEGDPIFTYKITNLLDDTVYYRTVRFDVDQNDTLVTSDKTTTENHLFSTDYYVCTAQITDLPQGMYKVEELDTMGYSLDIVGTDTEQTNCHYEEADGYVVYAIGFAASMGDNIEGIMNLNATKSYTSEPDDDHLDRDTASVIFVNKKARAPQKLTDTDVVKNSLVIGETMETNSAADNLDIAE